ncbi:MAG: hypothetical protein VB858_10735 [Planctomycetaceae bacterium]
MTAVRDTTLMLPLLIAALVVSAVGCGEPVPEEKVVAEENLSSIKSEILSTLDEIKAGDAEPSAVLDLWPEEDEVIPEAHRNTFDKLKAGAEALAEMTSQTDISAKIDEMTALTETLPGKTAPVEADSDQESAEDEK